MEQQEANHLPLDNFKNSHGHLKHEKQWGQEMHVSQPAFLVCSDASEIITWL